MKPGYRNIESQSKTLRGLLGLLAALVLLLAPAAPAPAATTPTKEPPKPQLLIFHGGSFLYEDQFLEPATVARAIAAGFEPHYVEYPLGNLPAAVVKAREEAKRLRARVGKANVYAYGASAGGTLAVLLSGEGLVAAAAAKAPVTDLVTWEWPLTQYGSNYYEQIGLSEAARARYSPIDRPVKSPVLIYQGRADNVVPAAMNEAFAATSGNISYWSVPGGHATDQARPWLIGRSLNWLAQIAAGQARGAARGSILHN
jgi:pimeloyl-ACP methyl ester carboxylesterase